MSRPREPRINDRIRITPIRLIGADGEQVGIIPVNEALDRAREANLDLVEVAGNSKPPVCRIMDYGRFKYETSKKQKDARKKQHSMEIKEMRFRPKVDTHDYEFKTKHIREFLEDGNKVKIFVMFRGREMAHTEFGRKLLERVIQDMAEISTVEVYPKQEGRRMNMVIAPLPAVIKHAAEVRLTRAKEQQRQKEIALGHIENDASSDGSEQSQETDATDKTDKVVLQETTPSEEVESTEIEQAPTGSSD